MLLCQLLSGPKAVQDLADRLDIPHVTISVHLARMRPEGIVVGERRGKQIFYSLADPRAAKLITTAIELYCSDAHL